MIYFLLYACMFFIQYCMAQETVYQRIQPLHLSSLEWEEHDWPNESFHDYLMRCLTYQMHPQERVKRKNILKIFDKLSTHVEQHAAIAMDATTLQDLNILCGKNAGEAYAAQFVDRTCTSFGKMHLYATIAQPIHDIDELEKRQKRARYFLVHAPFFHDVQRIYQELKQHENLFLSFWAQDGFVHSSSRHYFSIPYFENTNSWLNHSETALEVRSMMGHQQRFLFLTSAIFAATLLPVYGLYQLNNRDLPEPFNDFAKRLQGSGGKILALLASLKSRPLACAATITAGIYAGLGAKEEYDWVADNITLNTCIQTKMISVAAFFDAARSLKELFKKNPDFTNQCSAAQNIIDFFDVIVPADQQLTQLMELTQSSSLHGSPSFFTRQGRVLAAFKLMHELKDKIEPLIMHLAEIDMYQSIATLYKEFEHQRVHFCFVDYSQQAQPTVDMQNFWNPFVSPDTVITNSVTLQGPGARNMVITGPNAGGKSTLIKGIVLNIIFAQSLGIAAADNMLLTPLHALGTYLNVTDDVAAGNSLFKAQVKRIQNMIDLVEQTPHCAFSFIALDEMFNGTSAQESKVAAFSVAKHAGAFENNICVIATHFPMLTKLEQEHSGFKNYKVSVHIDEKNGIHYPFKLEHGISHQHVALDILRQEGYACSILDEATQLLKKTANRK